MRAHRVSLIAALLVTFPAAARAQIHRDVIRGTVTTDSGSALAGADVIITMAPDRLSRATKTDASGAYTLTFENGTGDYLVHVAAPGRETFRKRVTRSGADSVLVVDAKLAPAIAVAQLGAVNVQARKLKPQRGSPPGLEAGSSEKFSEPITGAIPPDQLGDINAATATMSGITVTSSGASVGGVSSAQNSTTLNGLAFAGSDVPRDANTRIRVSASTFDPARGWFGGINQNVELSTGSLFSSRRARFTLDAPALQYTDPVSSRLGQRFTNAIASAGGDGTVLDDRFAYNYGVQGSVRHSDFVSIGDAAPDLLERAGVSSDSVARLRSLLAGAGVPFATSRIPSGRGSQNASFIGRIDHAPFNWLTLTPARSTWGLIGYGKIATADAVGITPTGTAALGGRTSQSIASLQALYSSFFHGDYLTEARSSFSVSRSTATPYVALPSASVLVGSTFPDATAGLASLAFGGNSALRYDNRQWTWETTSETQFYSAGRQAHRVKLNADARLDHVSLGGDPNALGTFTFNSLADLAANQPSGFTRTLNAPTRTGGEWNGFVSLGDFWRVTPAFQLVYGARVEGNRFTEAPAFNPAIQSAFGVRTDAAPNTVHLSPRIGFTWVRDGTAGRNGRIGTPLGTFSFGSTSYIRGGIGEFRSLIAPSLLADASASTGLPGARRTLECVGPATPVPDWSSYSSALGTVPSDCAGSSSSFADAAPGVQLFDRSYTAPRSWRGNLSYASSLHNFAYSLEGIYSLNLNQPGRTDLNFSNVARFTTPEGRPVYASASSVVPATGAVSGVDARTTSAFGHVIDNVSSLSSVGRQLTFTIAPSLQSLSSWFASLGYTLGDVRAKASGFDAPTFGSPLVRETTRGDLDVRHQFVLQAGVNLKQFTFTAFGRLQSGQPYTPMVSGDVNGDGFANDRAFVFDPSRTTDTQLANGMQSLLASSSGSARECLTRQLGRAAGRNSCEGPWTAVLNGEISYAGNSNGQLPFIHRQGSISLALVNPLGGLDQLIHGSDHLRGWGTPAQPDPVLLTPRGFDASSNAFRYDVNPRFGSTNPANTTLRAPFRVSLDVSLQLGPSIGVQQLARFLRPGRAGHPGTRLTAADLKKRYQRNVPDPYAAILRESDSLLISRDQADSLARVDAVYRARIDSMWTDLSEHLAGLGDQFDAREALERQEKTIDAAWELSRQDLQRTLPRILSPAQLRVLPNPANFLFEARKPVQVRMFFTG